MPSESVSTYVNNVKVTFKYDSSKDSNGYIGMRKYGSYNTASDIALNVSNIPLEITVLLTDDNKDGLFTISSEVGMFIYAGEYKISSISYKIGSQPVAVATMPTGSPVITVASKAPSATITAISPTGNNPTKITYTVSWGTPTFTATEGKKSFYSSDNEATLYAIATADNSRQHNGSFTRPTITITIAGISNEYDATIILPAGSAASDIKFSRTGNGEITKTLGSVEQIKSWETWLIVTFTHTLNAYKGHETQTISTMTVSKNNVAYTIYLEKNN